MKNFRIFSPIFSSTYISLQISSDLSLIFQLGTLSTFFRSLPFFSKRAKGDAAGNNGLSIYRVSTWLPMATTVTL